MPYVTAITSGLLSNLHVSFMSVMLENMNEEIM